MFSDQTFTTTLIFIYEGRAIQLNCTVGYSQSSMIIFYHLNSGLDVFNFVALNYTFKMIYNVLL